MVSVSKVFSVYEPKKYFRKKVRYKKKLFLKLNFQDRCENFYAIMMFAFRTKLILQIKK